MSFNMVFDRRGLQRVMEPHDCTLYLAIFMSCEVFMNQLGGGPYWAHFHPRWRILLLLKWDIVWGYGCSWFSLMSYLGCRG